jgi:microcystin-dependent protein
LLGFGTWTAFGAGRVPVGFDSGNALFDSAEETGGSADAITVSHTHTATSTDSGHTHSISTPVRGLTSGGSSGWQGTNTGDSYTSSASSTNSSTANITTTVASTGSSGTNANYQPYITVYMWKRTA